MNSKPSFFRLSNRRITSSYSDTNCPQTCPPPIFNSKSYKVSRSVRTFRSPRTRSCGSSYNNIICGNSSSAHSLIFNLGGIRSSIVASVARIDALLCFSYEYSSRSTASTIPVRTGEYGVLRRTNTNPFGSFRKTPPSLYPRIVFAIFPIRTAQSALSRYISGNVSRNVEGFSPTVCSNSDQYALSDVC